MVWSLGSHRRSNWEKAFDYFTLVGDLHLQGKLRKPKCNIYATCFCLEHLINQEVAMLISWKAVNMESGMKMGSSFPSKNMVGRIIEIIDLSEKWVEMLHRPGLELIYIVKLCILSNLLMWNSFETSTWPRWEKNLNNQPKNGWSVTEWTSPTGDQLPGQIYPGSSPNITALGGFYNLDSFNVYNLIWWYLLNFHICRKKPSRWFEDNTLPSLKHCPNLFCRHGLDVCRHGLDAWRVSDWTGLGPCIVPKELTFQTYMASSCTFDTELLQRWILTI